jgi:hypothetical protein
VTSAAAHELQMPHSTVYQVLQKRLHLYAYRMQAVQEIIPNDMRACNQFVVTTLEKLHEFLRKITFSDKTAFNASGKVNKQNICICGSERPHATVDHVTDISKINVWCRLLHNRLIGPFSLLTQM